MAIPERPAGSAERGVPTESPPIAPADAPCGPAGASEAPPKRAFRSRLGAARDRLIHGAATQLIQAGRESPRLRRAGYWLYGRATRYLPRGKEVAKLGTVGARALRGAQPSLRAFSTLKEMGVTTVVNLRPECDYERPYVEKLGMRYFHLPLPALSAPTHAMTVKFLSTVTAPENGLVFFHCFHGVDRTGVMAACLRIARDGWTVDAALDEMRAFKVHERGQRAKVDYLRDFQAYWRALPEPLRREVLHLPPLAETPVPAEPAPWWGRAAAWLKFKLARRTDR